MILALKKERPSNWSTGGTRIGSPAQGCNYDYMSATEAGEQLRGWFSGRLPEGWFEGPLEIVYDREEITVVGTLPPPALGADASDTGRAAAASGQIGRFREETRERRIAIAREAEHHFGRKVSWGVESAGHREMFTTLSVPVMTRLRQPERRVLDTLVEAGGGRSRRDAPALGVGLLREKHDGWVR